MISNLTIVGSDCLNHGPQLGTNVIGIDVSHLIHNDALPIKVNLNLNEATVASIRRPIQTDDSDLDFQPVTNKRSQRKIIKSKESSHSQGVSVNLISSGAEPAQECIFDSPDVCNDESIRYALTRYPFPPFVIRFSSGKVTSNQVIVRLVDHCEKSFQTNIQILNC